MKTRKLSSSERMTPAALCAGLCLFGGAVSSQAQLTPEQNNLLGNFFGNRAELATILSGSDSVGGGSFTTDQKNNDDTHFSLTKFAGGGEIGAPRKLGNTGMTWNPVVAGSVGFSSANNLITAGTLAGNKLEESVVALSLGGGVAFHVTEQLTITPSVGMIYGHYHTYFNNRNQPYSTKQALGVDLDTLGATPGIGVAYKIPAGITMVELSSHYTFFGTSDISKEADSHGYKANGSTHVWETKVDVDVPLPTAINGCRLHTGGFISYTHLFGDLTDSMRSDYFYTIHPRLVADTKGKLWKVQNIGIGASLYESRFFTGWSIGVDMKMKF